MNITNKLYEISNYNYFLESYENDWISGNAGNYGIYSGSSSDQLRSGQWGNEIDDGNNMIRFMII
mgnify:CR=1 FL=1